MRQFTRHEILSAVFGMEEIHKMTSGSRIFVIQGYAFPCTNLSLDVLQILVIELHKRSLDLILAQKDTFDFVKGQVFVKFMLLENHLQRI